MLSYSYTNTKGKLKEVAPKPRGLTALTNQVLKAQERGVGAIVGSVNSQDLSTLDAVVTLSGSNSSFTLTILGFGTESSTHATVGEALREMVRLGKEYADPAFCKALRKKRFSITLG